MNYSNLIGYSIDTNQVKAQNIKNVVEAKNVIDEIIVTYGLSMLSIIRFDGCSTYTAYTYYYPDGLKNNQTLQEFLNN